MWVFVYCLFSFLFFFLYKSQHRSLVLKNRSAYVHNRVSRRWPKVYGHLIHLEFLTKEPFFFFSLYYMRIKAFPWNTLSVRFPPDDTVIVFLALKRCLPWLHWLHTSDLVLIGCQQNCSDWSAVINMMSEGTADGDLLQIRVPPC